MNSVQIEVLNGANPANPLWLYIGELLAIEGYTFRLVDAPSSQRVLLIVPHLLLTDAQKEIIRFHATNAGGLIVMRPPADLAGLFGLKRENRFWMKPYARHPEGDWMQVHGGADLCELAGAEPVATLHPDPEAEDNRPAVARIEEGGSRRACFTYDLAKCCVLIQQGDPSRASDGVNRNADGDWKFSTNDLYYGHLDPRLKHVPQSDLHRDLLVRMILWATGKTKPIPRLWRFPRAETSAAMMDGDGDNAPRDLFDLAFGACEEFGVPFSTYLMDDQFETITPSDAKALRKRGHSVGYHAWQGPYPSPAEFEAHLKKSYAHFRDQYGYIPSATRNHCVIWTGWVDTARVESEIGVRMDLNGYPVLGYQSAVQSGTLLPVKFMDATGRLLDIYSQFTVHSDDCLTEAKCGLPALTGNQLVEASRKWIEISLRHQGMYHPTFHPIRFTCSAPTITWMRETLAYLKSKGVRGWSADGWTEFNDARRTVTIGATESGWAVESGRNLDGATILVPSHGDADLAVDGHAVKPKRIRTGGLDHAAIVVDLQAGRSRRLELR